MEFINSDSAIPSIDAIYNLSPIPNLTTDSSIGIVSDLNLFILDHEQLKWKKLDIWNFNEFIQETPMRKILDNENIIQQLKSSYLARQITQLKFIQDLHSGRILSLPGKLLTDLTGIVIIILIVSGFIAWQRRKES